MKQALLTALVTKRVGHDIRSASQARNKRSKSLLSRCVASMVRAHRPHVVFIEIFATKTAGILHLAGLAPVSFS